MTSAESDYLFRLAALSLSFVGFSAVVVTLRGALGGELSDRHLRLVRLYIEGGLLVTALALVPTLLNLVHVPDAVIWPLSSAAAGSIFTFVLLIQFRRRQCDYRTPNCTAERTDARGARIRPLTAAWAAFPRRAPGHPQIVLLCAVIVATITNAYQLRSVKA